MRTCKFCNKKFETGGCLVKGGKSYGQPEPSWSYWLCPEHTSKRYEKIESQQLSLFEEDNKTYLEKHREQKELLVSKLIDLMMQKLKKNYKDKKDVIYLICIQAIQKQRAVYMRMKVSEIETEINNYNLMLGHCFETKTKGK